MCSDWLSAGPYMVPVNATGTNSELVMAAPSVPKPPLRFRVCSCAGAKMGANGRADAINPTRANQPPRPPAAPVRRARC